MTNWYDYKEVHELASSFPRGTVSVVRRRNEDFFQLKRTKDLRFRWRPDSTLTFRKDF